MTKADVAIIGAGPGGAACALTLARAGHSVVLLHRAGRRGRFSETLGPSAMQVVRHLGLDGVLGAAARVARGVIADWGAGPQVHDYFFTPDGAGLCVERDGFDTVLRGKASGAGAQVITARATGVQEAGGLWQITPDQGPRITARNLVDGSGRQGVMARQLGLGRDRGDPLFAYALRFQGGPDDGFARVVARPEGWWYCNAIPGTGESIAVFHTDRDLPAGRQAASRAGFLDLLAQAPFAPGLGAPLGKIHGAAAGSERVAQDWPARFLAVGDAAQALDPLSSQGLERALRSGVMAGQMLGFALANPQDAPRFIDRYRADQTAFWTRYQQEYSHFYGSPLGDHPFWHRRAAGVLQKDLARDAL